MVDLDAIELEGVEAEGDREGAQRQVDFVEAIVQPHGAVAADGAGDLGVEELVEVEVGVEGTDQVSAALVAQPSQLKGCEWWKYLEIKPTSSKVCTKPRW